MKNLAFLFLLVAMVISSCFNDLDTVPLDEDEKTSADVYDDPAAYKQVLARLYAGLAVSGQQGPAGQPDIAGIDEGFSVYTRQYWTVQQLPTDEAVIAWNDATIKDFHEQDWDANDTFIAAIYNRCYLQISYCNEFLRETTSEKLDARGVDAALKSEIEVFRAEARFLRALSYWHLLDLFRNVPWVTEADAVGSFFPPQVSPSDLFNFIETELKDIENTLVGPRQNDYGRADAAAAWMVLAKLYLNAEVYLGTARYTDCVTYCDKIINAGYTLESNYDHLFLADNDTADGIIFPVLFDGKQTKTFGGMTFMMKAAIGGDMNPADYGVDGGWGGIRTTSAFVDKFPATGGSVLVEPNEGNSDTYPRLYVPGSFQGWDPGLTTTVITSSNSDMNYEGYFFFEPGTEFKITPAPNWDNSYGDVDADGKLEYNPPGGNIMVADGGFYRLSVNLNDTTYRVEKTDWGIIGDATPGGWDFDTDMTYAGDGVWTITQDLSAGSIKFRANDLWDINFGDTGADAILEYGPPDNIDIPSGGTFKIDLFLDHPDYTYSIERTSFDNRAMFFTDDQSLEINDISNFKDGYAIPKYKNITSEGLEGSARDFPDTDFPMFRIADAYLMYAEAVLRGGGGDANAALGYVNEVRERAYGDTSGNIELGDMTLDFLLDERARELYWECHRRTDLVRYGRLTNTDYLWPWKGGVAEGISTDSKYDIFPIPASDIGANINLTQNPGY